MLNNTVWRITVHDFAIEWFYIHLLYKPFTCNYYNDSDNNNRICIAPRGRYFRGAAATGQINVQWKPGQIEKFYVSIWKQTESRWWELYVAASSRQTVTKTGNHVYLEKSVMVNDWTSSWQTWSSAVDMFCDFVTQVTRNERAQNFVRQNCQLVCDPLMNCQPMQYSSTYLQLSA